jgi:hypothetical protein
MMVELRQLKDNPARDFSVDPIDDAVVVNLKASIKQDGFWGGVVCRKNGDEIQIVAGHHRVRAAMAAGLKKADLFVSSDIDEPGLVRIYARENATHRGSSSTAQAGSVIAAVRFLAKILMENQSSEKVKKIRRDLDLEGNSFNILVGNLTSENGIGHAIIVKFLEGVPGINRRSVDQQLAMLKSSGAYARTIVEIRDEIQRGERDQHIMELAVRAAEAANSRPVTLDIRVADHLNNPHQVDVFRQIVTSPAIQRVLPVERQERLARQISAQAQREGVELSGSYIRDNIRTMVIPAQQSQRTISRADRTRGWEVQLVELQEKFASAITTAVTAAKRLADHERSRPVDAQLYRTTTLRNALREARQLSRLIERLGEE